MQYFPGFGGENSGMVSRDQTLDSAPGPSGHNSMDRKKDCKVFCPIFNRKFPVSAINEHVDACLGRKTTSTICITREDEGKNLEENNSQAINHISLSRNEIAAIISSAVCVCLYSSVCLILPTARRLWHSWDVRINDLLLWVFVEASVKFLHLYFWIYQISPSKMKTPAHSYWRENDRINSGNAKRWYIFI